MCLICVDFQKQKMTFNDARRAVREMSSDIGAEHTREVHEMIRKAELKQQHEQQQQNAAQKDP